VSKVFNTIVIQGTW